MTTVNVMRQQYRELTEVERLQVQEVKQAGLAFWQLCDRLAPPQGNRELDLAKIRMEEAVMWAVKHLTG